MKIKFIFLKKYLFYILINFIIYLKIKINYLLIIILYKIKLMIIIKKRNLTEKVMNS